MKYLRAGALGIRRFHAVLRRELLSLFCSPIAYIVLLVFLALNGITFYFYIQVNAGQLELMLNSQFGSLTFWFLTLLIPPLLTMRCFAEEVRTGSFEMLVTSGVGDSTLVLGKFTASWLFFMFLWISTLPPFLLLERVADLDWGLITTVYIGLALIGGIYCALGVFASSLSANQLVSASVATVLNVLVFFLHYFRFFYEPGDEALRFFQYLSPLGHFADDFTRGMLDCRYLVLYGSVTWLALFTTVKVLERRRWW